MRDLLADLLAAGGAATRAGLVELGHTHRTIRAAVERGALLAPSRSWVVLPDADPDIRRALASGGVLGGATALATFGVWVTTTPGLQVAMRPHSGTRAAAEGTRIWGAFDADAGWPWRVSVVDALAQHALRVSREDAIASIDSAWHQGLVGSPEIDRLFRRLPGRCAPWRRLLDPNAGSGLESLLRVPCLDRGWRVESQAPVPGGGACDLLIDGWLFVEADGSAWHDDPKQAAKDRRRNTAIMADGGRWLRFGFADVVHGLGATMGVIGAVLAQGRPRRPAA